MPKQSEQNSRQLPIPIDVFDLGEPSSESSVPSEQVRIWASVGPSYTREQLIELVSMEQLACIRVNMAKFARSDDLIALIQHVNTVRARRQPPIDVCLDTGGPKVRISGLHDMYGANQVDVFNGEEVLITTEGATSDSAKLGIAKVIPIDAPFPVSPHESDDGIVFISDGWQQFRILEYVPGGVRCEALNDAIVYEGRGVNLLGMYDSAESLTQQDRNMLGAIGRSGCQLDFVGLSFANAADDIHECRAFLTDSGMGAKIVAKIETRTGLASVAAIAQESDAIMVARGDLAVEVAPYGLDMLEIEDSIRAVCAEMKKECIVATRVADSLADGRETLDDSEIGRLRHELRQGIPLTIMLANETTDGRNASRNYRVVLDALREAAGETGTIA